MDCTFERRKAIGRAVYASICTVQKSRHRVRDTRGKSGKKTRHVADGGLDRWHRGVRLNAPKSHVHKTDEPL